MTTLYTEIPTERLEGESKEDYRKRQKTRHMRIWRANNKIRNLETSRGYRKKNREKLQAKNKRLYYKDVEGSRLKARIRNRRRIKLAVEYNRVRRQTDPQYAQKVKEWNAEWRRKNPDWYVGRLVRRGAYVPKWADLEKIKQIYQICKAYNQREDEVFHVDHIIPVFGKHVCGLHIESNLRIITRVENLRKSNKFEEAA